MKLMYDNLAVQDARLLFAGQDCAALADTYGTPLMLLDEQRIRSRCRLYKSAMEKHLPAGSHPMYASKALSIKQIYRIMAQEARRSRSARCHWPPVRGMQN